MREKRKQELVLGTQHSAGTFNGLMVLGSDEQHLKSILEAPFLGNISILDTAPIYARGTAEEVIGKHDRKRLIWTKIGVDVSSAIPRLDYSAQGMKASLLNSLTRIRRASVDVAFIHNPTLDVLRAINTATVHANLCKDNFLATAIGASLNDTETMEYLIEQDDSSIEFVMLEYSSIKDRPRLVARMADKYRIAVRGLFDQGRAFSGFSPDKIEETIFEHLLWVSETYPVHYLVVAPRTMEQALHYDRVVTKWYNH